MIKRSVLTNVSPLFQRSVLPNWRQMVIVGAIAFGTLIAYLYVVPISEINAARAHINTLKTDVDQLEQQDAELLRAIAVHSNMTTLQERARRIGMGPPNSAVYLRLPQQAVAPQPPAPSLVPSESLAAPDLSGDDAVITDLPGALQAARQGVDDLIQSVRQRLPQR